MANYKVSTNKDKETKCTQTKPKCDSEKAIQVQIHRYKIIIIILTAIIIIIIMIAVMMEFMMVIMIILIIIQ
jgi:hypothetical protein